MELKVKLIEENEILEDELEMLDITSMMFMEEAIQAQLIKPNIIDVKPSPNFTEPVDFNSTLAEMSIIEGNELLAVGSYEMAIERFKEAVKYSPNNKSYQTKLSEATELAKLKNSAIPKGATTKLTSKLDTSLGYPQKQEAAKISSPPPLKDTQPVAISQLTETQEVLSNQELKQTQEVSINETLAEMSFIEASDLLARGDQQAAIERIKEAIKYNPQNPVYNQKLNSILSESKPNKTSALKMPKEEAIPEIQTKLDEPPSKKNTKLLRNTNAQKTSPKISKNEAMEEGPLAITTSKKPKTSKTAFLFTVAAALFILTASLFYQSKNVSLTEVTLSYPTDQARLNKKQLEFEWKSVGDRFLLEIESGGKPVVKAYAQETRYKLTPDQVNLIDTKINYKWKVTPVDFKGEPIPHKTEEKWFEVVQN